MNSRRMYGIDLFRVLAALVVFMYHNGWKNYGIFNAFFSMGAIFMTAFFMMSGFTLFCVQNNSLDTIEKLKIFYLKRAISIYPIYWLYILCCGILSNEQLIDRIMVMPIKILGLQSLWHCTIMADWLGGMGTWFISCILFCYLFFPFIFRVVKQLSVKSRIMLFMFLYIFSFYSEIMTKITGWDYFCSNYADSVFRMAEFSIGVILASFIRDIGQRISFIASWPVFILEIIILVTGVTVGIKCGIGQNNYLLYNILAVPMFALMLWTLSNIKISGWPMKIIMFLSNISYAFYLMQYFAWKYVDRILNRLNWNGNWIRFSTALLMTIILSAMVTYVFERPVSKWWRSKTLGA